MSRERRGWEHHGGGVGGGQGDVVGSCDVIVEQGGRRGMSRKSAGGSLPKLL